MRKPFELRPVFRGMALVAVMSITIAAQQPPPAADAAVPSIENLGKPIAFPFRCTEDDIAWGGMSCSEEEPCPVYLELTAAEGIGNQIFVTGDLHSETVTLYSVFLKSQDSGKTWREAFERMRGAGLDHVQFADFANGWASGETIVPLPQDPFLLITADGGKTWRRQPIFDDPQPGSIQQFFFSSKNEGSLIVDHGEGSGTDRYALYESPNAGGTWHIKQASRKPLRLSHTPEGPPAWRVQADSATRSFRIEQRQDARWVSAASFAVSAGACRPAPPNPLPTPLPENQPAPNPPQQ